MKAWLILYNLASAVGWAYVLFIVVTSYMARETPEELWVKLEQPLTVVQTAATLEILHALLRWVRSPVFTTALQVCSRLLLVWFFSKPFAACQSSMSLYLMAGSWALVEVPRYLFYAANLVTKKVPFVLHFLRYNLFMVLYPSGISGEMLQIYSALPTLAKTSPSMHLLTCIIMTLYLPGGPFMFMNMVGQRNRANKKRNPRPPPKSGLLWPVTNPEKNERSTTVTGKKIWAASVEGVNPTAAEAIRRTKNWRFGYSKHVVRNVEICAGSTQDCIAVCKAGLKAAHEAFDVVSEDGRKCSLAEEMRTNTTSTFETGFIKGEKPRSSRPELVVPYKGRGLKGAELAAQVRKWVEKGTIEPSAGDAIMRVAENPNTYLDLSDKYFVLLGAGSAMGPLLALMALGANVIAVDLNRQGIWDRLLKIARESSGTMYFPLPQRQDDIQPSKWSSVAGCNLFTDTAKIRNWLVDILPEKKLIIGGYAYLDGALHVQVSVSMDAIMAGVSERRPNTRLCYLCSPTDVFANADEAVQDAMRNYKNAPWWQKLLENFGLLKKNFNKPVPSDNNQQITLVNGIVVQQGPNYALAKRIQHWRAMLSRHNGQTVSTNIAPSTATKSVVHNASFAAAYGGMHHFNPMEIFWQETSNAVMCALMLNDCFHEEGIANGGQPLSNPTRLFAHGAFHGGIWRIGYAGGTIGIPSAAIYYARRDGWKLLVGIAALTAFGRWLYTSTSADATA